MDFNLFHDCQECLFTIHLHFPFCMFAAFSFSVLVFSRPKNLYFSALIRHYNMRCLNSKCSIFINILSRLRRQESRWFQTQIQVCYFWQKWKVKPCPSHCSFYVSDFRFALLMLVMKLRNFFLKYPWNEVNWKSQFLFQECYSQWLMQESTKESKKSFLRWGLHFIYFAKSPCIW